MGDVATTEDKPGVEHGVDEWRRELYEAAPERQGELFSTISGLENEPLYTPETVETDHDRDLGYPGVYPFTRGVYPSMYRGRLWTMRQFAGFGTAEETNERFRYLLEHGQTGLSTAFDMPTLMGYDSDHPRSLGEVGREGVAIDSLADMETLFEGIPLAEVSTSMTINAPAAMLLAFYACLGEEQGVPAAELRGTIQTDILKEYIAQKEWIFPPEPSMRLVTRARCRGGIRSRSPATTSARPARMRSRSSPSPSPTGSPTSTQRSSAASTSTTSRLGCPSSSTRTSTSSRRSRSTAQPVESGPANCGSATAPRTRARG
jgi:hypothetical protein